MGDERVVVPHVIDTHLEDYLDDEELDSRLMSLPRMAEDFGHLVEGEEVVPASNNSPNNKLVRKTTQTSTTSSFPRLLLFRSNTKGTLGKPKSSDSVLTPIPQEDAPHRPAKNLALDLSASEKRHPRNIKRGTKATKGSLPSVAISVGTAKKQDTLRPEVNELEVDNEAVEYADEVVLQPMRLGSTAQLSPASSTGFMSRTLSSPFSGRRASSQTASKSLKNRAEKRVGFQKPIVELLEQADERGLQRSSSMRIKTSLYERYLNARIDGESLFQSVRSKVKISGRAGSLSQNNNRAPSAISKGTDGRLNSGLDVPILYRINMDVFTYSPDELVFFMKDIIDYFDLNLIFKRDDEKLFNFLEAVKDSYYDQPFHNWYHGFSVAHMTAIFLDKNPVVKNTLKKRRCLALIVAALGHDLCHPGHDNMYEVLTGTPAAKSFNEQSVLENFHISNLLKILEDDDKNLFFMCTPTKQAELREFMVNVILATDMKHHNVMVAELKKIDSVTKSISNAATRQLLCNAILHASDISAQTLGVKIAIKWEDRVAKEFQNQKEACQSQGLDIPPHWQNVDLTNHVERAKPQLGFVDFVLAPLWKEVARLFPPMDQLYINLTTCVRDYYRILSEEGIEASLAHAEKFANMDSFGADLVIDDEI